MNTHSELCTYFLSYIRAVGLIHQNHHWVVKGKAAYGNHLLFERLYNSAAKDADAIAEKLVGLFGVETLDLDMQATFLERILKDFSGKEPIPTSLAIEKKFISLCNHFYEKMEHEDKMTLGLDDLIMAVANSREEAVYLLQQASEDDNMNSKMAARKTLLKRMVNATLDTTDPVEQENQAKQALMQSLSSATVRLNKGLPVNFNLSMRNTGAKYSIIVMLNEKDKAIQPQLQAMLMQLVNSVPFLRDKVHQANVGIFSANP